MYFQYKTFITFGLTWHISLFFFTQSAELYFTVVILKLIPKAQANSWCLSQRWNMYFLVNNKVIRRKDGFSLGTLCQQTLITLATIEGHLSGTGSQ